MLDSRTFSWRTVREVDIPPDPRISGAGLSQGMTVEAMNAHFAAVLNEPPHVIDLAGLRTDHLRVECDREHPVWPSHGECNGGEYNVPFGIFNGLTVLGRAEAEPEMLSWLPGLNVRRMEPRAPAGMTVSRLPNQLLFSGKHFSIGFSLNRPILMHLGWDAFSHGIAALNRLTLTSTQNTSGISGPVLRTLTLDCLPQHWTGTVNVKGNKVSYRNLRSFIPGVSLDAEFTVEPDGLILSLIQRAGTNVPALETAAWQLAFDVAATMTAVAGEPILEPGRNGEVKLPAMFAGDRSGCLSCAAAGPSVGNVRLQAESYNPLRSVSAAFVLGQRPDPSGSAVLPAGRLAAEVELRVSALEPVRRRGAARPGYGLASNWSAIYSCFRPEYGGFSNQAVSVNVHSAQQHPAEIIPFTRRPAVGPDPLNLLRFTVGRALMDGGGYCYWRNLYMDADPMLLVAAGRCYQADPSADWLHSVAPGLRETVRRVLNTIGSEGLSVCRDLSGDSKSYRWSSNAMDVVGFGHMDACVNAYTYRALRNAAAMLHALDDDVLAGRCQKAAGLLRSAFTRYLVNPETGWVAGWRSRDGNLHDYAFPWVNGPAIAFGLLEPAAARKALRGLERLRLKVGAGTGYFGLPFNLIPLRPEDHMLPLVRPYVRPTFEHYTDGAMGFCATTYYLRALSIYGLKKQARKLARELEEGYAAGLATGGSGAGVEMRTWAGLPCGYEGTFGPGFSPLYALAIEQGIFDPPEPEWWPAGG